MFLLWRQWLGMISFFLIASLLLARPSFAEEAPLPFMGAVNEPHSSPGSHETIQPGLKPTAEKQAHVMMHDVHYYQKYGKHSEAWDVYAVGGLNAFELGNNATGLVLLRTAYEKGCRDPLVLLRLALYFELKDDFKNAEKLIDIARKDFASVYSLHPEKNEVMVHAARILYEQEKYTEALPLFEIALKQNPHNVDAMLMSGQILREQKQYAQAKLRFERALGQTPNTADNTDLRYALLRELLVTSYSLQDYPSTLNAAKQILDINPNDELAKQYQSKIERDEKSKRDNDVLYDLVK
ncbi:MAG: hypothetical protein COX62_08365 [Deltaproteobacteria bacterium CG_4_10_14_0_2_um_filter_43_8]|nr:MAG: hypothetical protein COV43_09190 [Deltaproteobacteria bacterium CG11_big_fil_rev_8_21_14_0_20_42_23]PJA18739.1 MAG: hypothetical protein COX62_08365 [Deltaproteobacteria bacterium CG_4_10_14_0_2_um_filter_43_8]PJC64405.1 MAG: hypothetical protein CO021_05215 [Deltaproteobacteria bacterium CG_4_9_14_0_2_um_filter_42_21]